MESEHLCFRDGCSIYFIGQIEITINIFCFTDQAQTRFTDIIRILTVFIAGIDHIIITCQRKLDIRIFSIVTCAILCFICMYAVCSDRHIAFNIFFFCDFYISACIINQIKLIVICRICLIIRL